MATTTTRTLARKPQPSRMRAWRKRFAPALAKLREWRERVREWREARALLRLNERYARERNDHERYLSKARDVFELERLEREWMRRHTDLWRIY